MGVERKSETKLRKKRKNMQMTVNRIRLTKKTGWIGSRVADSVGFLRACLARTRNLNGKMTTTRIGLKRGRRRMDGEHKVEASGTKPRISVGKVGIGSRNEGGGLTMHCSEGIRCRA
jgi:hypothetical protein